MGVNVHRQSPFNLLMDTHGSDEEEEDCCGCIVCLLPAEYYATKQRISMLFKMHSHSAHICICSHSLWLVLLLLLSLYGTFICIWQDSVVHFSCMLIVLCCVVFCAIAIHGTAMTDRT